jgi:hypothetical protein
MKALVKKHENSLNTIKAHFDELKRALESVRSLASSVPSQQEYEDLRKFDAIITGLKERWERAVGVYGVRRSSLKKCLYTFHEHMKALNNEKQGLEPAENTTPTPTTTNTTTSSSRGATRASNERRDEFIRINGSGGMTSANTHEPKIAVIKKERNQRKNSSDTIVPIISGHQKVDSQLAQMSKVRGHFYI